MTKEQTYRCSCIKCGHTMTVTGKHCEDAKCPKCGATMRRAERPGPGKEASERFKESVKAKAGLKDSAYQKIKQVTRLLTGAGVKPSVANTLANKIIAVIRSK